MPNISQHSYYLLQEGRSLTIKLRKRKTEKKVEWSSDTVDNEHLGRRSSKCEFIFSTHTEMLSVNSVGLYQWSQKHLSAALVFWRQSTTTSRTRLCVCWFFIVLFYSFDRIQNVPSAGSIYNTWFNNMHICIVCIVCWT